MDFTEKDVFATPIKVRQGKRNVTMWKNAMGKPVTTEDYGLENYERLGYSVMKCKNNLIASLVSTLIFPVIQDPKDSLTVIALRHSTKGITFPDPATPDIFVRIPRDFGRSD